MATGLVQEFQFGMNWSDYSRFVGDVFGAPLAFEALIAFFFESTFIGLWIFGWDKLPKHIHAACMWVVALGTVLPPAGDALPGTPGRRDALEEFCADLHGSLRELSTAVRDHYHEPPPTQQSLQRQQALAVWARDQDGRTP